MRKILIMCAAICLVAFVSSAFAEVQNVKVSGDLEFLGVSRDRTSFGLDTAGDDGSSVIQSITRVRIDADLTDNVSTSVRLLNERDWDEESSGGTADDTDIDVDLAYVTLREMLYSPLTVTLGRQNLRFGNAMIIGDPDTNNQSAAGSIANRDLSARKSFDAIRGTLDYDPLVIDLIYSKIDENDVIGNGNPGSVGEENDDIDLYGINAAYDLGGDIIKTIEGYVFYKHDNSVKDLAAVNHTNAGKSDTVICPGVRLVLNPIENLILQTEFALQFGHKLSSVSTTGAVVPITERSRRGKAAQVIANYAFDMDYSPVLSAVYSYASGDQNSTEVDAGGDFDGWDPMFEDQSLGHLSNALFDNTNCHLVKVEGSIEPMEDVNLALAWIGGWMDKKVDTQDGTKGAVTGQLFLRLPGGGAGIPGLEAGERHVLDEIDLTLTYDYTEDVQFKLIGAWLEPGAAFVDANSDAATELIASCKVLF